MLQVFNVNDALKQRAEKRKSAELILATAQRANRDLTTAEQTNYDLLAAEIKTINADVDRHALGARPSTRPGMPRIAVPGADYDYDNEGTRNPAGLSFLGIGDFITKGEGGIQASLSEGSGGTQYVIPGWQVQQFITAYPSITPFEAAGATVFQTDDGHTIKVPIIAAGSDVGTFAEEAGPTSDTNANVYVASLGAHKYSFLTKLSEELRQDVPELESTLAAEGIRRVYNSISKAVTSALITSLTSANALVTDTGDYLHDLLNLEAAIDPTWSSPSNCFMMDTSSLAQLRNVRDLNDRPIFDPATKSFFGYRTVINQALRGRVLFGAFGPAVFIRKTPLAVLRLLELYSESGKIGIRFQQRADQAFFSDAATATQAPQPIFMLTNTVGS